MPNVFGPSVGSSLSQAYPLYDPRFERAARQRFRRSAIPELQRANAMYVPGGFYPARGWILLRRADYVQINPYSINLGLEIDDGVNPVVDLLHLTVVQARCVSTGSSADPDAIYLVELTDRRGILFNQWFAWPIRSSYNVRAPAYPEEFYSPSLNGGVTWTWTQMVLNIWNQMGALLGTFPGLPVSTVSTPEGWQFPGTSAWRALNSILDLLGCSVSVNLAAASPYGITQDGATDAAASTLLSNSLLKLEDDLEWIDTGSGRVPAQVIVLFHRRNEYYGTEETVRRDSLQWTSTPSYSVTVNAPAAFGSAQGQHYLWTEFTVRYDVNGVPLPADVILAAAIAAERAQQYYNRIYRGTLGFMSRVYAGALPFATGSMIDGVAWRMRMEEHRLGWQTEVVRGMMPPWPEIVDARH